MLLCVHFVQQNREGRSVISLQLLKLQSLSPFTRFTPTHSQTNTLHFLVLAKRSVEYGQFTWHRRKLFDAGATGGAETNSGRGQWRTEKNKATESVDNYYLYVGRFYVIDHTKLPKNSPVQLKSVRVAVDNKVWLKYPSIQSVCTLFSDPSLPRWKVLPAFDEKYRMTLECAIQAPPKMVLTGEMAQGRNTWSFWVSPSEVNDVATTSKLESADVVDIRREGGVEDPYWTPPPGWKLGDNLSHDHVAARELREIKEELLKLKRDMWERKHWL